MKSLWQILLGILLSTVMIFTVAKCGSDHQKELSGNFTAYIVSMNSEQGQNVSKRHISAMIKSVLFKKVGDNNYFEMNSSENGKIITDEWFYNHFVGDTVHFEYIRKDRFFSITRRPPIIGSQLEDTLTREQRLFGK